MLHIIRDHETLRYNLLVPETGKFYYKEWVDYIEKTYIHNCVQGKDTKLGLTFFIVTRTHTASSSGNKYSQDLLDANGNVIASGKGIEVWFDGSEENPPILCIRLENKDKDGKEIFKEILTDLGGTALTDRSYDRIESYNNSYWRDYIRVQDEGKYNFIRKSDYTLITQYWFDKDIRNHAYDSDPNYVATVKYRGRWRHLRADGTLSGPIKQYT